MPHESVSHSSGYERALSIVGKTDVSAGVVLRQRLQQCLGLLEVGRVKALGKPGIDWRQKVMGFPAFSLLLPESSQAEVAAFVIRGYPLKAGQFMASMT